MPRPDVQRPGEPATDVPLRVVLATRRDLLAIGLRQLAASSRGLEVTAVVTTVQDACQALIRDGADVVVIDEQLDGDGGRAIAQRLDGVPARARWCVLVDDANARGVARLARAGASGVLSTAARAPDIVEALQRSCTDDVVMDPVTAHAVATEALVLPLDRSGADLSDREHELLRLLAEGRTNREIAAAVFLSEKTVKNSLSVLFRKLGVRSRTEAALLAAGADPRAA